MMIMKGDMDDFGQQKREGFGFGGRNEEKRAIGSTSPQAILPGLQRLCKTFLENQQRIENMLGGSKPIAVGKYS